MAEPQPDKVFGYTHPPQCFCSESPEGVKAYPLASGVQGPVYIAL
ncbi:MAG: hypothetical protein ABR866_18640 [Candidatus Korobacteraceae bacterium]|jgi:hypothetical protein